MSDSDFLVNLSHAQPAVGDGNVMQKEVLLVRLLHGAWRSRVFFLQALRGFAPWNPPGFVVTVITIFPSVVFAPRSLARSPLPSLPRIRSFQHPRFRHIGGRVGMGDAC